MVKSERPWWVRDREELGSQLLLPLLEVIVALLVGGFTALGVAVATGFADGYWQLQVVAAIVGFVATLVLMVWRHWVSLQDQQVRLARRNARRRLRIARRAHRSDVQ